MPQANHWWTTRPKRKLITIVDVLRVFLTVAEGKVWSGNRTLHREFEKALEDAGLKGVGTRRDGGGGGGRTYASWLYSFGLWFAEDATKIVRSTLAGHDLLKGRDPVPILTEQILNFQYPSVTSRKNKVDLRFKLFPFRFVLNLLLDSKLKGYVTEKELAAFAVTRGEKDSDLAEVVNQILKYRKNGNLDSVFDNAFETKYASKDELNDIANTIANQLEFTQLIDRETGSRITILPGKIAEVQRVVGIPRKLNSRSAEPELFQRNYGLGPHHKRDNRNFTGASFVSAFDAERSKVLVALWGILAREPIKTIDKPLLARISAKTGISETKVETIITAVGVSPSYDAFERKFLQLSMGGTLTAKDFERATEGVFGVAGLGFGTEWIGSSPNNPDVLAISTEPGSEYLGVIDAKAYKAYTISGDHRRNMSHNYIRSRKYPHNGRDYDPSFFSYVAGGLGSTINNGIVNIHKDTSVKGSAITAQELLNLLKQHRLKPFSKSDLERLFTLNRQILPTDFVP